MQTNTHGGACCGVSHIFNFNEPEWRRPNETNRERLDRVINAIVEEYEGENGEWTEDGDRLLAKQPWGKTFGRLFEVVLTDQQMIEWAPILKAKGFRLCHRFMNDNSGNYCNLLTYATKKAAKKAPYKW